MKIQEAREHIVLNSKSEYNRCALPRLANKIGENDYKKWEKNQSEEKEKDKELEEEIRKMRMKRNKGRQPQPSRNTQPAAKKRKTGENNYFKVYQEKPADQEKRKLEGDEIQRENKKRKVDKDPEPSLGESEGGEGDPEMGKDPPNYNKSSGENLETNEQQGENEMHANIVYGEYEEVELLEFDYYQHLENHEKKRKLEEKIRGDRIEQADRIERTGEGEVRKIRHSEKKKRKNPRGSVAKENNRRLQKTTRSREKKSNIRGREKKEA